MTNFGSMSWSEKRNNLILTIIKEATIKRNYIANTLTGSNTPIKVNA